MMVIRVPPQSGILEKSQFQLDSMQLHLTPNNSQFVTQQEDSNGGTNDLLHVTADDRYLDHYP